MGSLIQRNRAASRQTAHTGPIWFVLTANYRARADDRPPRVSDYTSRQCRGEGADFPAQHLVTEANLPQTMSAIGARLYARNLRIQP